MNNIKYYYAIFSRTIKKNKMRFLYFTHHFFFLLFFFYRGKNHFNIIFYYFLSSTNSLAHFVRFTSQNNSNYPVQILLEWYFFQQHFFFFFHTPIQPLIAIVSRVTIIYIPFSPHTRRSTFLLITREHSGALIWATGEIRRPRLLHA